MEGVNNALLSPAEIESRLCSFGSNRMVMICGKRWATAGSVHRKGRVPQVLTAGESRWMPGADDKHMLIAVMAGRGYGFRAIAERLGLSFHVVRLVFKSLGLDTPERIAERRKSAGARGEYGGSKYTNWQSDHRQHGILERKYDALYRQFYAPEFTSMQYYRNHEENKRLGAALARRQHRKAMRDKANGHTSNYLIAKALRSRVYCAIKGHTKSAPLEKLLGCSIQEMRDYLEAQFDDRMTWANHGEWHIDHIRPCASFDLSLPENQRMCFHHTNMQPMWADENRRKSSKWKGKRHRCVTKHVDNPEGQVGGGDHKGIF